MSRAQSNQRRPQVFNKEVREDDPGLSSSSLTSALASTPISSSTSTSSLPPQRLRPPPPPPCRSRYLVTTLSTSNQYPFPHHHDHHHPPHHQPQRGARQASVGMAQMKPRKATERAYEAWTLAKWKTQEAVGKARTLGVVPRHGRAREVRDRRLLQVETGTYRGWW